MSGCPKRGEIYWVNLDPTVGTEIKKTRPALILSNDIGNEFSKRVIVAPITSSVNNVYRFQVKINIFEKECKVLVDQLRSVDKLRLGSKIVSLSSDLIEQVNLALKITLDL